MKTDEIETDKGHVLVVGFKGKIRKSRLKDVLKEAHKQKCVIIANHPLHKFGVSYFLVEKILGEESGELLNNEGDNGKKLVKELVDNLFALLNEKGVMTPDKLTNKKDNKNNQ